MFGCLKHRNNLLLEANQNQALFALLLCKQFRHQVVPKQFRIFAARMRKFAMFQGLKYSF